MFFFKKEKVTRAWFETCLQLKPGTQSNVDRCQMMRKTSNWHLIKALALEDEFHAGVNVMASRQVTVTWDIEKEV